MAALGKTLHVCNLESIGANILPAQMNFASLSIPLASPPHNRIALNTSSPYI